MEGSSSLTSPISTTCKVIVNPHPLAIKHKIYLTAEKKVQEILSIIQPSGIPDLRRQEVISYIQKLFKDYFGLEVFPFGSVPLRTYLPDGDVDLTALCPPKMEAELARNVTELLKSEEKGSVARVRDVQHIPAQVQIVKCTVNDIPVDISFNQKSGLSALCFKEKVSQLIGKNQLYKHSVLLIKAWCFYESRVLGAHQGLISTYAIETLVIYILNLFHASLSSPLAVLHRFLHYYSLFDWQNFCASISGPVLKNALPDLVEVHESERMLLSERFLRKCKKSLSLPLKKDDRTKNFELKFMNIVDPLKINNNLGRSVSKGNFSRIKFVFSDGAKRLGEILKLKEELMSAEIDKFFANTLARNGRGVRCDVKVPISAFGVGRSKPSDLSGDYDTYFKNLQYSKSSKPNCIKPRPPPPVCAPPNFPIFIPPRPLRPICVRPCPLSGPPKFANPQPNYGPLSPYPVPNINAGDSMFHGPLHRQHGFFLGVGDAVFPNPPIPRFPNPYVAPFNIDNTQKSRGTGTFIPEMSYGTYKERMKLKNHQYRRPRDQQQQYVKPGNQQPSRYPEFIPAGSFPQQGFPQQGCPQQGFPQLGFPLQVFPQYGFPPQHRGFPQSIVYSPHGSTSPQAFSPQGVPPPGFLPTGFSPRGPTTREFRPRSAFSPKTSQNTYPTTTTKYVLKVPQNTNSNGNHDVPKVSQNTYTNGNDQPKAKESNQNAPTETKGKLNGDLTVKHTNGSNVEFSMDEFPLLPVCKKPLVFENQSGEPSKKSAQVEEKFPSGIQSIAFGTYGSLPPALPIQQEKELPESDKKERSVGDSYQLIDDTEFPPLGRK